MNTDKLLARLGQISSSQIFLSVALVVSLICAGILFAAMVSAREEVRVLQARIAVMEREISTAKFSLPNPISAPYQGKDTGVKLPGTVPEETGKKP